MDRTTTLWAVSKLLRRWKGCLSKHQVAWAWRCAAISYTNRKAHVLCRLVYSFTTLHRGNWRWLPLHQEAAKKGHEQKSGDVAAGLACAAIEQPWRTQYRGDKGKIKASKALKSFCPVTYQQSLFQTIVADANHLCARFLVLFAQIIIVVCTNAKQN